MRTMEKLKSFHSALLAGFTLAVLIHAQDQSGFISIDCGWRGPGNRSGYGPDPDHGINFTTDENFTDTGIDVRGITNSAWVFSDVRSFPEGKRNCYTLSPAQGKNGKYLIRASFKYGNYDGQNSVPQFDLYLGANLWETITLADASTEFSTEIIHVPSTDYIFVCLINTGHGVPFISALELRPLDSSLYKTQYPTESIVLVERLDLGSNQSAVRYPNDTYDRIWTPRKNAGRRETLSPLIGDFDAQSLSTSDYHVPIPVMSTAIKPSTDNASLVITFDLSADPNQRYYSYKYFAELEELDNQTREFIFSENGKTNPEPIRPEYLSTLAIVSGPLQAKTIHIEITKTDDSNLPPILNAIEIYRAKDLSQLQTLEKDVYAMIGIRKHYQVKKNTWQGDPCAPKNYLWEGLNCSGYESTSPLRIISLNLSLSGLSGEITPIFADLTALQNLNLSYNSLSGPVPNFFSRMPSLEVLNLKGNAFTGSVPAELKKKLNSGSLVLSVDGNPDIYIPISHKKKKKFMISVVAAVISSSLLSIAMASFWIFKRRKQEDKWWLSVFIIVGAALLVPLFCYLCYLRWRKSKAKGDNLSHPSIYGVGITHHKDQNLMHELNVYNFQTIVAATSNFSATNVLGKGGFGAVYKGILPDGQEMAIKRLSKNSNQGVEEFRNEAMLIAKLQHTNLVRLLGYSLQGEERILVYEYLPNKSLDFFIFDSNRKKLLNWKQRFSIIQGIAQGLVYLHKYSRLKVIHRDLKASNILLDDQMNPKISDFGMARIFGINESIANTNRIVGTYGYMPSEYAMNGFVSIKIDVYGFGVLVLEIVSGKKNTGCYDTEYPLSLVGYAWQL